jgi:predicted Zn-ribbon and HTH transcriptional regulator
VKKGKCKNCGSLHDNELYEGPAKGRCDNCGSIFSNKSKGKCPFCKPGEIEALDEDDIAALELYADDEDNEEEHDHNHE